MAKKPHIIARVFALALRRSGAVALWLVLIAAALAALTTPPVGRYAKPLSAVEWIAADYRLLPRRPLAGETPGRLDSAPLGSGSLQFTYRFDRSEIIATDTALYIPGLDGNRAWALVNGVLLPAPDEPVSAAVFQRGAEPFYRAIEKRYLHPGPNRIDIIVEHPRAGALRGALHIGPEVRLSAAARAQSDWNQVSRASLPILTALLVFLVLARAVVSRVRRGFMISAGGLAFTVFALAVTASPGWAGLPGDILPAVDGVLVGALLIGLAAVFVRLDRDGPAPRRAGVVEAVCVANLLLCLFIAAANPTWAGPAKAVALGFGIAGAAGIILLHARRGSLAELRWAVLIGFVVFAALALAGALGLTMPAGAASGERALTIITGLGMIWLIFQSAAYLGRLLVSALREGLDLRRLVQRQSLALSEAQAALAEQARERAILQERERLARDMHDGIGGQLASLLAQLQGGRVDPPAIERAVQNGLRDLRLIVDSLDSAGDQLGDALLAFEDRARPQIEAAGLTLAWRQTDGLDRTVTDPAAVLSVYRWLQEAVANVLRHAEARRIEIDISVLDASSEGLVISVRDDGRGFNPSEPGKPGKGLANMAKRAERLGGRLEFTKGLDGAGARVALVLPDGLAGAGD
ncbi:MAG: ATP-binding protein [Pseudomonadota bacterium]